MSLLVPILFTLLGLCAATEYYVTPRENSCSRTPCYTLDELATKYFYTDATDVLMDNVTVILLSGTHELYFSLSVKEVSNFTLLGVSGEHPVEIKCRNPMLLEFIGVLNLTIMRIMFSQCGDFESLPQRGIVTRGVLIFMDVFNLKMTWVVIRNSTKEVIFAVNVFGNSLINHSTFETDYEAFLIGHGIKDTIFAQAFDTFWSNCIYIHYDNINLTHNSHRFSDKILPLLLAVNSHKLSIHNCVLKNSVHNSVSIDLQHAGYSIEFYLTNITIVNGSNEGTLGGDIYIDARNESNYLVTIRDSYINSSRGNAISLHLQRGYLCQTIHVINTTIGKSAAGIHIHDYSSPGNEDTMIYPQIIIENCIIRNICGASDYRTIGFGLLIFGELGHSHISVTLSNVSFENNQLSHYSGIELYEARRVELIDCRFVGNEGTSVAATDSTFKVSGTLSFVNNTAYQGGAMGFYGDSYMSVSLKKYTQIFFINNYAKHVGGAIHILKNKRIESPRKSLIYSSEDITHCFLLVVDIHNCSELNSKNLSLTFTNNTARNGGDAIYGGSLHSCNVAICYIDYRYPEDIKGSSILIFEYWNTVHYNVPNGSSNLSLVTSEPTRVCLCEDGEPDCFTVLRNDTHYPGETFSISAVVVGQGYDIGTTDGSVYAWFLPLNKGPTATFNELQQSQLVNHRTCTKLQYTVLSANEKEVMALTTNSFGVQEYPQQETVDRYIRTYNSLKYSDPSPPDADEMKELLSFPVYINISLLPCPPGFILSDKAAKCVCHTTLQQHNLTCNIDDQTVHRGGTVWVNASFAGNKSNGVVVHHHCPYGYCSIAELDIRLDFPDTQCNFNHSGTLCGGCRLGLSLTLGGSQCLRCSNKHIALLIPFAIAGIVLVVFIKLLNLTVSEGTLNGLIFYANIIGANQATFFPSTSTHCPVLIVFIAWLNLDLGIEICFFNGLNGYWKTWLQFVFPAYIWTITAVIIVVAHYSSTGARLFGNNSVQVLATLFLLSYTKLLRTIITTISFTFLNYPDHFWTTVWLYDGNIRYFSPAHTLLFLVALTVFLFLWLPYTVVLLFMQCIRKKSHLCCFARLKPLFDAYFGPLKDKHCYWVGIMLLVRVILLIISAVNPNNAPKLNLLAIVGTTLLLLAYEATAGKVYRKRYISFLENSFLFNLGALAAATSYYSSGSGQSPTAVVHTLVGIAFLQFIGIIVFHGYCSIKNSRVWQHFRESSRRCTCQAENRNLDYLPFDKEQAQPVRIRLTFNELREPVLEYADENT